MLKCECNSLMMLVHTAVSDERSEPRLCVIANPRTRAEWVAPKRPAIMWRTQSFARCRSFVLPKGAVVAWLER